jgi:hypothetical protein
MKDPRTKLSVTIAAIVALVASALAGEASRTEMEAIRDAIRADKKAVVAANLDLTEGEAKAFWPIYDRYQADLQAVRDRAAKVVEEYAASYEKISDDQASNLTAAYLLAEQDGAALRRAYLVRVASALPGRKLARFYQIENKLDAIVRYELAAAIPLVRQ